MGSNDNSIWEDITGELTNNGGSGVTTIFNVNNNKKYLYYKLEISSSYNTALAIAELQFYGEPDYDSRTYIYDNGVEVMEVSTAGNDTYGTVEKRSDYLYLKATASTPASGKPFTQIYTDKINAGLYTIARWTLGKMLNSGTITRFGCFALTKTAPSNYGSSDIIANADFKETPTSLEITSVNDNAHIVIFVNSGSSECSIETVWLE